MTIRTKICKSLAETQALACEWVRGLEVGPPTKMTDLGESLGGFTAKSGATVVGLSGDLGSGKTSFVQGVANALGVSEHVTSPTFILERIYKLSVPKPSTYDLVPNTFSHLVHIDAYRLDSASEL